MNNSDEKCYNVEALAKRNWPSDIIIKMLYRLCGENAYPSVLYLDSKDWREWLRQMGHVPPLGVYGPGGFVKIEKDPSK